MGLEDLELATEDEVAEIFWDCERGAIPPFGRPYGVPIVVDAALASLREIVTGGNTRHEGIRLRARDYLALENPLVARIGQVIQPPRRRLQYRAG